MKILIVEDEIKTGEYLSKGLTEAGFVVDHADNGLTGYHLAMTAEYDLVILDIMLPDVNGWDIIRMLRTAGKGMPVLLLTALGTIEHSVKGLELGADDYLVKPFDFDELLARIRAMTRKHVGSRSNLFTVGDLTVDTRRQTAERGGREIALLPKEFAILEHLVRNKGVVVSREQLEDRIWNYEYTGSSNNVDVYMSRLRKKIDEGSSTKLIHTIRGAGWVIREERP